ncbi:MerR family transcriptional regulator [Pseudosulfitobacter sp. DSM 107133]|uniref:MerR family transcriptional regulator n=1 Tax=Pseudosulfitobacter sp. DSM 107133 TaxID=2883100 RepID=UPI000DF3C3CD|nr:MerR family transcriptional regulator [Pseudosulfitobacter sp. DSM 107133]UOA28449.1 HTH-type transcriptional regulator CueR [Pseudosulfitobacter sp. DSM 107133]
MRIGELAKRSGFTRDAIRLYERSGLIKADTREADNNYKSYPEGAVFALEIIRDAQAAGMSIHDLSKFMRQLEAQDTDDFDGDAFLADKIVEIEDRIQASKRFLATLQQTRVALAAAPYCDDQVFER